MVDEDFVPCLFSKGKECNCINRGSTNTIIDDELKKKQKARATFAALWRTDPAVGAFTKIMQRARPKAYANCLNKPKH